MKCFDFCLLKKLTKDAVAVNFWNRKTLERFKKKRLVVSIGIAQKGRAKGRECVLLQSAGEAYFEKLKQDRKESFRFWIALWMNPLSAIIGAVVGFILAKCCS